MKRGARTLYGQSGATVARIYADAAAMMESNPNVPDADIAIGMAAQQVWRGNSHRSIVNTMLPRMAFRDFFGCWCNNDDGVLMLCFAAAAAATGDLV